MARRPGAVVLDASRPGFGIEGVDRSDLSLRPLNEGPTWVHRKGQSRLMASRHARPARRGPEAHRADFEARWLGGLKRQMVKKAAPGEAGRQQLTRLR